MYVYHNIETDGMMNVRDVYVRQTMIERFKKRFLTYGYKEITTSVFENYDLYAKMNGTVNHKQMIKTIDHTGEVLVLRPDVTIPLTEQLARNNEQIDEHIRYFYVQDVFRQEQDSAAYRESTQAGVEFFGSNKPEADAEVIALAIDLLRDAALDTFTIEIGHAGFFKGLIEKLPLDEETFDKLTQLIRAKNVPEIEQFIQRKPLDEDVKEIVMNLPFLYGKPEDVIEKVRHLPLPNALQTTLTNMNDIYTLLKAYGVEEHVVFDLSLINHMDYYSDMIFQGFIGRVGRPVIMGGRYDTLASEFGSNIPAIGFACDIDYLIAGMDDADVPEKPLLDVYISYAPTEVKNGLQLACMLREENFHVICAKEEEKSVDATSYVTCKNGSFIVQTNERKTCSSLEEVVELLQSKRSFQQ